MAAENQFLRDSVLTLLDFLEKAGKQIPSIQQAVSFVDFNFYEFLLFCSFTQMQTSAEFESIKRGVAALSTLTFCQPTGVPPAVMGMPSVLGKRSAESNTAGASEGLTGCDPSTLSHAHQDSKFQYVPGINHNNPIYNAWMVHQGDFEENNESDSDEEDEDEEGPDKVPLHVAVGYGEESYPFYHDMAHPFPGYPLPGHPILHPSMLAGPDVVHHPLGMWPFAGPESHPAMGHFRLGSAVPPPAHSGHPTNGEGSTITSNMARPKAHNGADGASSSTRIVPRMQPISDTAQRPRSTSSTGQAASK
jgi:hypothetical protein